MRIGVPKETWPGELRAALVPAGVKKLVGLGFSVTVQAGVGAGARITDEDYRAAGATIAHDAAAAVADADIVTRVRKPADADLAALKRGVVHISFLDPFNEKALVGSFAAKRHYRHLDGDDPAQHACAKDGCAVVAGQSGGLCHRDSRRGA